MFNEAVTQQVITSLRSRPCITKLLKNELPTKSRLFSQNTKASLIPRIKNRSIWCCVGGDVATNLYPSVSPIFEAQIPTQNLGFVLRPFHNLLKILSAKEQFWDSISTKRSEGQTPPQRAEEREMLPRTKPRNCRDACRGAEQYCDCAARCDRRPLRRRPGHTPQGADSDRLHRLGESMRI